VQEELRPIRTAAADAAAEVGKLAAAMGETKKAADAAQQALAQAQAAVATKQDAANAVNEAAAQTEAAAKKLPDEKPLAEAAAKFKERAVQLAAEVAAAAKAAADQDGPVKAAAEKLAAAQKGVEEATGKQNAANAQVEGLEVKNAGAISKIQADRAAAKLIERRLQTLNSLVAYRAARQTRDASHAAWAKLDADLTSAKGSLAKLAGELPAKRTAAEDTQKQHAEALKALSDAQQQFAAKNDLHQTVALAAAKAEAARQKLPNDAELAQAAQTVKTRADQLAAETAELQKALVARQQATDQVVAIVAAAKQGIEVATAEVAKLEQQIPILEPQQKSAAEKLGADQQNYSRAAEDLIGHETGQFATASLKPLTPEQLAASVIEAAGLREQLRGASEAEINAKTPLTDAIKNDPAQMAARNLQIDEATYAKLQANFARFVELFGTGAGQPQGFFASADQALFFGNDGQIRGWLSPSGGNLTDRLGKLAEPRAVADELYLSVLSRRPSEAEIAEVTNYLTARATERPAALQELAWGLITSLEFRFNH
jgi:chromosome segregation ATPase